MNFPPRYRDRREAGRVLGSQLRARARLTDAIVLALPRGGVPVAAEVARALDVPLDVFIVRKLGVPQQPELAMGAIASGGFEVLNKPLIAELGITPFELAVIADREVAELARREALYRRGRPQAEVRDRTCIVVDDGLATGFTMRAAIEALRHYDAGRLVVAVPVGAPDACAELADEVDELWCPLQPEPLRAIGHWFDDFAPTTDREVEECLAGVEQSQAAGGPARRA